LEKWSEIKKILEVFWQFSSMDQKFRKITKKGHQKFLEGKSRNNFSGKLMKS